MSVFTHDNHPGKFFEQSKPMGAPVQYREIGHGRKPLSVWKDVTKTGKFSKSKFRFYCY